MQGQNLVVGRSCKGSTDIQDGLFTGKISDTINMLVSRMSVPATELMSRVYQMPKSRPNCLYYKPPSIVDGGI
jgi:hypothetical protein